MCCCVVSKSCQLADEENSWMRDITTGYKMSGGKNIVLIFSYGSRGVDVVYSIINLNNFKIVTFVKYFHVLWNICTYNKLWKKLNFFLNLLLFFLFELFLGLLVPQIYCTLLVYYIYCPFLCVITNQTRFDPLMLNAITTRCIILCCFRQIH